MALPGKKIKSVVYRGIVAVSSSEYERLHYALAGLEYAVAQEYSNVWIAGGRHFASILEANSIGKLFGDDQQVSIHNRRAAIRNPVRVRLPAFVAV